MHWLFRASKIFPSCAVILGLALWMPPVSAQETPIAHWTLDEGQGEIAGDSSGNGHDGILINDPPWTQGNIEGALAFNGFDHAVIVADAPILATPGQLTLAAWVRHPPTSSFRSILDKRDANEDGYDLYLTDLGTLFMRVNHETLEGFNPVADGTWHHVAGIYDGTQITLYVDGQVDVTLAVDAGPIETTSDLVLGRHFGDLDVAFAGRLDDVQIYDVALGTDKVLDLISAGGPPGGTGNDGDWEIRGSDLFSAVDGNVGIGTETPSSKLDVIGDIRASGTICNSAGACLGDSGPGLWQEAESDIYFSGGNVGIGTDSPNQTLDVEGTVQATRFIGDGSGLSNLPGLPVDVSCPQLAYIRGFDAAGGLLCSCLPGYVLTGGVCQVPEPGEYRYNVNPYGGCAGGGMDVRVERRYAANGWEYRAVYKFRSDYAWQSSLTTSDWFTTTQSFEWAHGRDNPWFQVQLSEDSIVFHRGDCKGGTSTRWGYASWQLTDIDFLP